ncbi:MAG: PAS domain S-box protein [Gemmataceae bacterium]
MASAAWFSLFAFAPAIVIASKKSLYRKVNSLRLFEWSFVVCGVMALNYAYFVAGDQFLREMPLPILSILVVITSWVALRFETRGMANLVTISVVEVAALSLLLDTPPRFFTLSTSPTVQNAQLLLVGLVILIYLMVASVAKVRNRQDAELILFINALRQKAEKLTALNDQLAVQRSRAESQTIALLEQNAVVETMNRELAQHQAWMNTVFSSMPVGVYVIDKDERELDRRQRMIITPRLDKQLPSPDIEKINADLQVSFLDGRRMSVDDWPLLKAVRRGIWSTGEFMRVALEDGSFQILSVNAAPIQETNGQITGAVAISMDVTERETKNQQIRDQEERMRFSLSAARTIAWERDVNGGMLRRTGSLSRWLGYEEDINFDHIENFVKLIHPEDREGAVEYFQYLTSRCGEFAYEYRLLHSEGKSIWVASRGEVTPGPDGQPKRIAGVHIDITALKEAEQKLKLLESAVEHARDAVVLLDANAVPNAGRSVLYVNNAFCDMSGYAKDEVVGRSLNVLRGPDSDPATLDNIREALDLGKSFQAEVLNYRKNGTAYWVDLTLELVRDHMDRKSHWVMIQRDITDRKRSGRCPRRSETMFRGIFENAAWAGVSLTAASSRFISANPAFLAMLDRTEAEVLNLHTWEITTEESWKAQQHFIEEILSGKRDRYQIRKQYLKRDGQPFWGELFVNVIRGPNREFLYGLGVTVDVTERTRLENQLRASEQRLRAVYENTAAGFLVVNSDDTILEVNPAFARMLGYEPAEMIGLVVRDLTHPDDISYEAAMLDELMRGVRQHVQVRKRFIRKDRTHVAADLFTKAVRDADKRVLFRVGVAIDVSERVELEEQLRQAQKMEAIGQMAGGIAHDFNNLLTAVIGNLSLVDLKRGEANELYLKAAEQASVRAAELTKKLLGYARRSQLILAPTRLESVITEVVGILRHTLDPRIVIRESIQPCPPVFGDSTLLNQVLFNLLLNSRDAMPHGGVIEVSLSVVEHDSPPNHLTPGQFVHVAVIDNGHGMSPETKSKIFEPYYTTKGFGKGTGLGLPMVLGIIQQHEGWIDCETTLGFGTRFDLYLPVAASAVQPVFAPLPPPVTGLPDDTPVDISFPASRHLILLVDDDELVRSLALAILTSKGYVVHEASDGFEAVEWVKNNPRTASLIVMDLTMPRMSGRDAFRQILEIDPTARVLFSSGYTADEMTNISGGVGMLAKPYRPSELLDAVERAIAGKSLNPAKERSELSNLQE